MIIYVKLYTQMRGWSSTQWGFIHPLYIMDEGRMTTVNPLAAKATAQIQYGITVLGTDDAQSIQDTTDGCASCFKINQNTGTAMSL